MPSILIHNLQIQFLDLNSCNTKTQKAQLFPVLDKDVTKMKHLTDTTTSKEVLADDIFYND